MEPAHPTRRLIQKRIVKLDKSAYFPLGLVLGLAAGAVLGNAGLGALFGMLAGLTVSTIGRSRSN